MTCNLGSLWFKNLLLSSRFFDFMQPREEILSVRVLSPKVPKELWLPSAATDWAAGSSIVVD